MSPVLIVVGLLVLAASAVDVVWTVLAAGSGAGPITSRTSALAWRVALRLGRRAEGPRHALLAVFGLVIVVGMLLSWAGVVYGAWWIISAADGAVRMAETGAPADVVGRAFFVGYNLFTVGSTTYVAGDGLWQALPVAIAANGLVFLSLGISYLVPVAAAVGERRQLARHVLSLGRSAEAVLTSAWNGTDFGRLEDHLLALVPMVHLAGERQRTYPALAYFHSVREQASSSISIVVLDDVVTLLRHGVAHEARPDRLTLDALHQAVADFLSTMGGAVLSGDRDPLPPPELGPLRAAGVPSVGDADFTAATSGDKDRRRMLAGLLAHDGWRPAPGRPGAGPRRRPPPTSGVCPGSATGLLRLDL